MCGETLQEVTDAVARHTDGLKTDGVKVEKVNQIEGFHQIVTIIMCWWTMG